MPIRNRVVAVLLGIAAGLLLLELLLRVAGLVHLWQENSKKFSSDTSCKILCIGDSYTLGIGASNGHDYPAQLQAILDSRCKARKFSVINRGVSSANSSMTLRQFGAELLDRIKPDIVILMSGGANAWNALGRRTNTVWENLAANIRVYKLIVLLAENAREKARAQRYSAALRSLPDGTRKLGEQLRSAIRNNDWNVALGYAEKIVEQAPSYSQGYASAAVVLDNLNQPERAADYYRRAIELDPSGEKVESRYNGYTRCMSIYAEGGHLQQETEKLKEAVDFLAKGEKRYPHLRYNIEMLLNRKAYLSGIRKWLESDLDAVRRLCSENGIRLIIMNYPQSKGFYSQVNKMLEDYALQAKIPFLDNGKIFKQKLLEGYRPEELYAPDQHCNDRGYGIVAENVFAMMASAGFLE